MTLPRRDFVAGSLVGLPFLLSSQTLAAQKPTVVGPGADPVLEEIQRQLVGSLNDMERAPADAARRHAMALRMLAALGAKEGYDKQFGDSLRRAIRTRGREAIIAERPDFVGLSSVYVRELGRQGIKVNLAERFTRQTPLDMQRKSKALDALLADGVVATWRRQADTLYGIASDLEAFRSARQPTKAEQLCEELNGQLYQFEILVGIACIFGTLIACGTTTASYLIWKGYVGSTYNCW